MVDLELVGDVHEHTQVHVEDCAGIHVSGYAVLVLVRSRVRAPEYPLAAPEAGRRDPELVQGVGFLLVVAAVLGAFAEVLAGCHDRLV